MFTGRSTGIKIVREVNLFRDRCEPDHTFTQVFYTRGKYPVGTVGIVHAHSRIEPVNRWASMNILNSRTVLVLDRTILPPTS